MISEDQLRQRIEAMYQQELIIKALNDYLTKCIQNNHRCAHCYRNHNGTCSFAKECFENDQRYYNDEDEE